MSNQFHNGRVAKVGDPCHCLDLDGKTEIKGRVMRPDLRKPDLRVIVDGPRGRCSSLTSAFNHIKDTAPEAPAPESPAAE